MPYLLDANIFIEAKNRHYSFDFCPAFWDWLDLVNQREKVFSIDKVRDELIEGDDELAKWAKARGSEFFLASGSNIARSLSIVSAWAEGSDYSRGAVSQFLQAADYYLVSHAHAYGFDVVTHEVASNSLKRIKIPDACVSLCLKSMSPYELLREEKARFVLGA